MESSLQLSRDDADRNLGDRLLDFLSGSSVGRDVRHRLPSLRLGPSNGLGELLGTVQSWTGVLGQFLRSEGDMARRACSL